MSLVSNSVATIPLIQESIQPTLVVTAHPCGSLKEKVRPPKDLSLNNSTFSSLSLAETTRDSSVDSRPSPLKVSDLDDFELFNIVDKEPGSITFKDEVNRFFDILETLLNMNQHEVGTWVGSDFDRTNRSPIAMLVVLLKRLEQINTEPIHISTIEDLKIRLHTILDTLSGAIQNELSLGLISNPIVTSEHNAHLRNIKELKECLGEKIESNDLGQLSGAVGATSSTNPLGRISSVAIPRDSHKKVLNEFCQDLNAFLNSDKKLRTELKKVFFQPRVPAADVLSYIRSVFTEDDDIVKLIKDLKADSSGELKKAMKDKLISPDFKFQHLLDVFHILYFLEEPGMVKDLILADFKNPEELYATLLMYEILEIKNTPVRILVEDIEDVKDVEKTLHEIQKKLGWDDKTLKSKVLLMFAMSDTSLRGGEGTLTHTKIVAESFLSQDYNVQLGKGSTPQRGHVPGKKDITVPHLETLQPGAFSEWLFGNVYPSTVHVERFKHDHTEDNNLITYQLKKLIEDELAPDYVAKIGGKQDSPKSEVLQLINDNSYLPKLLTLIGERKTGSRWAPKQWNKDSRFTDYRAITSSGFNDLLGLGVYAVFTLIKLSELDQSKSKVIDFLTRDSYQKNKFVRDFLDSLDNVLASFSIERLRMLLGGTNADDNVKQTLDKFEEDFKTAQEYFKKITERELKPSEDKIKLMKIQTETLAKFKIIHQEFLSSSSLEQDSLTEFNDRVDQCFNEYITNLECQFNNSNNLLISSQIAKLKEFKENYFYDNTNTRQDLHNNFLKLLHAIAIVNDNTLFKIG